MVCIGLQERLSRSPGSKTDKQGPFGSDLCVKRTQISQPKSLRPSSPEQLPRDAADIVTSLSPEGTQTTTLRVRAVKWPDLGVVGEGQEKAGFPSARILYKETRLEWQVPFTSPTRKRGGAGLAHAGRNGRHVPKTLPSPAARRARAAAVGAESLGRGRPRTWRRSPHTATAGS